MSTPHFSVPTPDLRIIPTNAIHPHEEHDSQRAIPLIEQLSNAQFLTNPPIVAPMENGEFVVLDGANRYHSLAHLGYDQLLVQVADYHSGFVELDVWQHIISDWQQDEFVQHIAHIQSIRVIHGWDSHALARILFKDGIVISIDTDSTKDLVQRNQILCEFVRVYQQNARLDRTALKDTAEIWSYYPNALALVRFPQYQPKDIIHATQQKAFLPPGISRHIIHGRALQLNYPLANLKDSSLTLEEKNQALQDWIREKFARRSIRFYAESTYQFNE